MPSMLESLPNELLDALFKCLDDMDSWANLCRCSKRLYQTLRDHPYRESSQLRNRIMRYACKHGNTDNLELAVFYGASPTVVNPDLSDVTVVDPDPLDIWHAKRPEKESTLRLSLMGGQPEAFEKLIELGAETIWPDTGISVFVPYQNLLANLSRCSSRHAALCALFSSGSQLGIESNLREGALTCLIEAILAGASLETADALLHFVDNVDVSIKNVDDQCHMVFREISPLLAAVSVGAMEISELLLERGSDFMTRKRLGAPKMRIYHPPIFEAASALARVGSTEMLQECLDHGVPVDIRYERFLYSGLPDIPSSATILLAYLLRIPDWGNPKRVRPVDGVKYILRLFETHGGSHSDPSTSNPQPLNPQQIARKTLDWMLCTRSLVDLAFEEYFHVIKYLAEYATEGLCAQQVIFADPGCKLSKKERRIVERRWCAILKSLLRSTNASEKDRILYEYIIDRGINFPPSDLQSLISIECLIQVGANINAGHKGDDGSDETALHHLCKRYQDRFKYAELGHRKAFLALLVRAGADPMLRLDTATAIDHLEVGLWKMNKKAKRSRVELIDILKSHLPQN